MSLSTAEKPALFTVLSPALLHLYDLTGSIVVVIDVLRATSTIATALHNGAREVVPVTSIAECIKLSEAMGAISAGERDGKVADGLEHGNSPFTFPRDFISGKSVVLTTTNGTRLLHEAVQAGASEIVTAAFANFSATCAHLKDKRKPVVLACAAWRNKVNLEDTLFAGAVVRELRDMFDIHCDASAMAETLYDTARHDLFHFMKERNASHYNRLMGFGLEKDLRYCLTKDTANTLTTYRDGRLIAGR